SGFGASLVHEIHERHEKGREKDGMNANESLELKRMGCRIIRFNSLNSLAFFVSFVVFRVFRGPKLVARRAPGGVGFGVAAVLEGVAIDDAENERGEAVVFLFHRGLDARDMPLIVVVEVAAEGEGE